MTDETAAHPPTRRVALGFALAPLAAAAFVGVVFGGLAREPMVALGITGAAALFYAYPLGLLVALPLYLWIRTRRRPTWPLAAGAGAVIGAAPMLLFAVPMALAGQMLSWRDATEVLVLVLAGLGGGVAGGTVLWAFVRPPPPSISPASTS